MQVVDQKISARWILPIIPDNTVYEDHCLIINQGQILAICPSDQADHHYQATENITLNDHVLMPGLVNAHTHSPMVLYRGLADDLALMDWLNNHIWPAEGALTNAESITAGMQLAIAEMLRGGTTCFNEMYFFPNEAAHTAARMGMRGCIGHTIMNVPTGWAKDEDEYIAKARDAHQNRVESPLITWSIAPQGPYTNSDRSLKLAKELADQLNLIMNMHVHETTDELNIDLNNHDKHPLQRLYDLGLLDERFTAIHMVHLNKREIEMVADTGMNVVHCPESNLKLASGFAPVKQLLEHDVNVAIGTDGAASNNDLDMFSELRTAALLAKAVNKDSTTLPAYEALKMATLNGARAIGLNNKIGSLEVGKLADVIAVDLGQFITQPVYQPISHLAYAVNRLQVSHVWINGELLLNNGQFTRIDIDEVVAQAQVWAKEARPFAAL